MEELIHFFPITLKSQNFVKTFRDENYLSIFLNFFIIVTSLVTNEPWGTVAMNFRGQKSVDEYRFLLKNLPICDDFNT